MSDAARTSGSDGAAQPRPLALDERIGGVLAAPRATFARLAAGEARAADVLWLLFASLVARDLQDLVRAALRGLALGVGAALQDLLMVASGRLPDVLGILVGGFVLSLFLPRSVRTRALDLGAYAWVPYLTVEVAGSLAYSALGRPPSELAKQIVLGAALAWAVAVWAMALAAARKESA
jgi:hypothetical protein